MMTTRYLAAAVTALSLLWTASAAAQQPWVDAGQQAMIQHNNNLIEQQSAPDQEEEAQRARKARGDRAAAQDERCDIEGAKARLRPEYDRRVAQHGQEEATKWLRQTAADLGRYAAENC